MKTAKRKAKTNEEKNQELTKKSDESVEVQIEKNFFVKTRNPDRVRLEKWKIGRRNFS